MSILNTDIPDKPEKQNRHKLWELRQMQALPLEVKIEKSKLRIKEWYEHFNGKIYVAFSGGKDSLVTLDLVRSIYPEVVGVFVNTGLEFPNIVQFVRKVQNIVWLKPEMSFRKVIETYGYPLISKETSERLGRIINGTNETDFNKSMYGIMKDGRKTRFKIAAKWHYLIKTGIKISAECCNILKKNPSKKYEKETGNVPIIGTMACESQLREQQWLQSGCNAFDRERPTSKPISFWNEIDIWGYIRQNGIEVCDIYNHYKRSGCIFCMFGVEHEAQPNRFQTLQKTHPKLWRYCMKDWDCGGLGLRQVLEHIGVPFENFLL